MPLEEQELPKYLIMSSPQLVGFTNCPIICLCCDVRYDFRVKNKIKKKIIKKKKTQSTKKHTKNNKNKQTNEKTNIEYSLNHVPFGRGS
jgi:hypothetical protein